MKNIPELKEKTNFLGAIANFFIERYKISYLIVVGLVILGLMTYQQMPRETSPEVAMSVVLVTASYPGASAEDIENLITNPIEDALGSLDNLDEMSSTSANSVSTIFLFFEEDIDMDEAEADVNAAINRITFPDDATDPNIFAYNTSDFPMMQMILTGDYELTDLKQYGEDLQSSIEGVAGISEVELTGGYDREIKILVSSEDLISYNLSASDITSALAAADIAAPSGTEAIDGENYSIRIDEGFSSISDIKNTIVRSDSNGTLFVKDVANVVDAYAEPSSYSYQYIEGMNDVSTPAVYLAVYRESGYDMVVPAEEIKALIAAGSPELFPEDVNVVITSDDSVEVEEELNNVINNALSGFLVVIIVLFLFIGLNESLIVAMIMPLSLLVSIILLDYSGTTLNVLSLTGFIISLGLIVDNAIVIMENVDRLRSKGLDRKTASQVGTNQVAPAVLAATLTTMAAFVPLAMLGGNIGNMIRVLPLTVVFTIAASLIMSLSMTPTFCALFLPKFKEKKRWRMVNVLLSVAFVVVLSLIAFSNGGSIGLLSIIAAVIFGGAMAIKGYFRLKNQDTVASDGGLIDKYGNWVGRILEKAWKRWLIFTGASAVLVLCIGLVVGGVIQLELFPSEEPDTLYIKVDGPQGYLIDDTDKIVKEIESELYKYGDIESFNSSVGSDGEKSASITIELVDIDLREISGFDLMDLLREDVSTIAGAEIIIEATTSMGPSENAIEIIIAGDNFETMEMLGKQYEEVLSTIPGVVNPLLESTGGMKEMNIVIDEEKAATYNLSVASISNEVRQRISGVDAGNYTENSEEVGVRLYIDEDEIHSVNDFQTIYFQTMSGSLVNFYDVASIETQEGISTISHIDGDRVITLSADVDPDYNTTEIMATFEENVADIQVPKGVGRTEGGSFRDLNETVTDMVTSYLIAILLVYIILVVQFNSLSQPIVILISVPLALIGVVLGLLFTGNNMGTYSMMGIIALVGIAVNDAIVLLDYNNTLRHQGYSREEALVEAVKTRFKPVMSTSITTIGGVLPLAINSVTYGQLGYSLIFGLITSTLLTLLIIPIVLYTMDNIIEKIKHINLFRRAEDHEKYEKEIA